MEETKTVLRQDPKVFIYLFIFWREIMITALNSRLALMSFQTPITYCLGFKSCHIKARLIITITIIIIIIIINDNYSKFIIIVSSSSSSSSSSK